MSLNVSVSNGGRPMSSSNRSIYPVGPPGPPISSPFVGPQRSVEHIAGLDVSMDDTEVVHDREAIEELDGNADGFVDVVDLEHPNRVTTATSGSARWSTSGSHCGAPAGKAPRRSC